VTGRSSSTDTIGSISVGVTGAYASELLSREIDVVIPKFEFDPAPIPSFLDTSAG
jgi:hypothetical protein